MKKTIKHLYYSVGAALIIGAGDAQAQFLAQSKPNNFSSISGNITDSIANLPSLVAALSYLFGLILGVLGITKLKDHVENPTQTPLKDAAIRIAAGGALFALPIVYEAAEYTIGIGKGVQPPDLAPASGDPRPTVVLPTAR